MQFQSKYRNITYIVRKTGKRFYPTGDFELIPGLFADFQGPAHIFDSKAAQAQFGWSDEERKKVEDHLLKHPDYGNGLYLAPGETLTAAQRKVAGDKAQVPERRCGHLWTENYEVKQCQEIVVPGTEFCEEHSPENTKITQGLMTTEGKV